MVLASRINGCLQFHQAVVSFSNCRQAANQVMSRVGSRTPEFYAEQVEFPGWCAVHPDR
jgi:hypothetical protein